MSTNEHYLISAFKRLIERDTLGSSYLLFGPSEATRRAIGAAILGMIEHDALPLIDGTIIDEQKNIGIEDVRTITGWLWQKPLRGKRKGVFITNAEALTGEAQNALLKIVEEPPQEALFILSVNDPSALIAPLISRCERVYVAGVVSVIEKTKAKQAREFIVGTSMQRKAIIKKILDDEADIGKFVEALLAQCIEDPMKHWKLMQGISDRWAKIAQYNTNKKLQLETLMEIG